MSQDNMQQLSACQPLRTIIFLPAQVEVKIQPMSAAPVHVFDERGVSRSAAERAGEALFHHVLTPGRPLCIWYYVPPKLAKQTRELARQLSRKVGEKVRVDDILKAFALKTLEHQESEYARAMVLLCMDAQPRRARGACNLLMDAYFAENPGERQRWYANLAAHAEWGKARWEKARLQSSLDDAEVLI